jgi:hypothetical protein
MSLLPLGVHDLAHGAVEDDASLMEHDHARADLAHEIEIMLDQQDAERMLARQHRQDGADERSLRFGEPRRRLVEQ